MGRDAHGNPMSGDDATITRYDAAIDRYLRFHPDVVTIDGELTGVDAPVPMACALHAYLHLSSTDPGDLAAARDAHALLVAGAGNDRERGHAAAIGAWLAGDWTGAGARLDDVLARWPADLLALVAGHQLDFFVGDAHNLRDRPARTLRELDPADPHAGFVLGMSAFGLEESGHYAHALDAGLAAVAAHPDDVWAIHAVVHTHEMQGTVDEGLRFLAADTTRWERDNLFTVHNWWHRALFELEAGHPDRALAIYDAEIHHDASGRVPIEMLDASALLWRLLLDDVDTGGRFGVLADDWAASGTLTDEPWYVFNDLHATMALAGAGRIDEARGVATRLAAWLERGPSGTNVVMTADVGLPACRAVVAFAEGRHDDVVDELAPIRRILARFGGSHAQRDALQRTLLESALRAGRFDLARALTAERLAVREASVYTWMQRARALRGIGDDDGASKADAESVRHRARFGASLTSAP